MYYIYIYIYIYRPLLNKSTHYRSAGRLHTLWLLLYKSSVFLICRAFVMDMKQIYLCYNVTNVNTANAVWRFDKLSPKSSLGLPNPQLARSMLPRHYVVLPMETLEMRKRVLTLSLAKPR
jgi:hypothetical protein